MSDNVEILDIECDWLDGKQFIYVDSHRYKVLAPINPNPKFYSKWLRWLEEELDVNGKVVNNK